MAEKKKFHYEWIPASDGDGSSNTLVKVLVED